MSPMKQRQIEIKITRLSSGGNGRGEYVPQKDQCIPVEVPFTLSGESVRTTLFKKSRRIAFGRLDEVLEPAPERISPKCSHFGSCGGCRWQHLSYANQLKWKQEKVVDCFESILTKEVAILPIVPCEEPWAYRNKMEYTFSNDAAGNSYLGLIIDSSRGKVLNLSECHLVNPWFTQALHVVREWWADTGLRAYFPRNNTGSLRTLTLREGMQTGDRLAMLTVSGVPEYALTKEHIDLFVSRLKESVTPSASAHLSIFIRIQQTAKGMPTQFYEMHLSGPDHIRETLTIAPLAGEKGRSIQFKVSPSAFFQPNSRQAERLYSTALQLASLPPEGVVYDLYCGTGTLGICMAPFVKRVIGIEISPESALDAKTNAAENGLNNVEILCGSVQEKLVEMSRSQHYPQPDFVVVDPPRMGLDKTAIEQLVRLSPPTIVYISCNPATQAENAAELLAHGYKIKAVQPVDQFPHTLHIENIVIFSK